MHRMTVGDWRKGIPALALRQHTTGQRQRTETTLFDFGLKAWDQLSTRRIGPRDIGQRLRIRRYWRPAGAVVDEKLAVLSVPPVGNKSLWRQWASPNVNGRLFQSR